MMYTAYMRWGNAQRSEVIATSESREFAEAAARERLARWYGQCRELPRCFVCYNNTGATVYVAKVNGEGGA